MNTEFNRNEDWMKLLLSNIRQQYEQIKQGGGKTAIDKQHARNKLTARERVDYLCDNDKPVIEIGAFAGFDLY